MILKKILIFGILISNFSFAENVEPPCNHSDSDSAEKIAVKQRIDNMFREFVHIEPESSRVLDDSSESGAKD